MKDIDFLPEWYKEQQRRQWELRRQCIALVVIFLVMMGYNLAATHRIAKASAELSRFQNDRVRSESILYQFDTIAGQLNELRQKTELIERMDSRLDMGAVLAEMSSVIGESTIISQVEFVAEPVTSDAAKEAASASAIRVADKTKAAAKKTPLGDVRFRIRLVGLAASSTDVGDLVCRLEDSLYFRQVSLAFCRNGEFGIGGNRGATGSPQMIQASQFELTCYLANYEEVSD